MKVSGDDIRYLCFIFTRIQVMKINLLIIKAKEIFANHLVRSKIFISHSAYFVCLISLSNFNGKLIELLLSGFLYKVDEDEVVEALL